MGDGMIIPIFIKILYLIILFLLEFNLVTAKV